MNLAEKTKTPLCGVLCQQAYQTGQAPTGSRYENSIHISDGGCRCQHVGSIPTND